MFKLKFVLPMLAFVLAIGMSFAFVSEPVASDEAIIYQGQPVEVNVGCMGDQFNCLIQLVDDSNNPIPGEIYQVYGADSQGNHTVLLKTNTDEPFKVRESALGN